MTEQQRVNFMTWLAALRSGAYKQGRSSLWGAEGFCCLGVACDIATRDGIGYWAEPNELTEDGNYIYDGRAYDKLPPVDLMEERFNLTTANPIVPTENDNLMFVASLNDSGMPFDEIADALESTYLKPKED